MADETVSISLQLELQQLRQEMAKIPGIGKREASAMVREVSKQYKRAERAAQKLGKTTGKELAQGFQTAKSSLGGLNKTAASLGGTVGGVTGQVESLVGGLIELHESMGAAGVAAGAVGLGIAAVGTAAVAGVASVVRLVEHSNELLETWDELHSATPIPAATVERVRELAGEFDAARTAGQRLEIIAAGELAVAFEGLGDTVTGLTLALTDNLAALREWGETAQDVGRTGAGVLTLGMSEAARAIAGWAVDAEGAAERGREFREEQEAAAQAAKDATAFEEANAEALKSIEEQERKLTEAMRKRREEAAKLAEATERQRQADLDASIEAALQNAGDVAELRERQRQEQAAAEQAAMDERLAREQRTADLIVSIEASMTARRKELNAQLAAFGEDIASSGFEIASIHNENLMMREQERHDRAAANLLDLRAKRAELRDAMLHATSEEERAQLDAQRAVVQGQIKGNKALQRSANERAKRLFRGQQALAFSEVGFNTAAAVIKAFALYGPPPSPVGIAGAASALAAGTAQAMRVRQQRPPEFAAGGFASGPRQPGSPDHVQVAVDPREGILRRQAVDQLGGRDAVNALNEGRPSMVARSRRDTGRERSMVAEAAQAIAAALDERQGRAFGQSLVYGAR